MQRGLPQRLRAIWVMLLSLAMFQHNATGTVITVGASKDNTIFQNTSGVNNSLGAGQGIFAGTNNNLSPRRGLMAFDIAAAVPSGSTITSVKLTLYLAQAASSGGGAGSSGPASATVGLYALFQNWGEGTAGGSTTGLGMIGGGFAAAAGDATWNSRLHSSALWTTPGAGSDASGTASASLAIGTDVGSAYSWGSTSAMVADVQGWLNFPATNFGWLFINADEINGLTLRGFWTRDAARTPASAALVPQLEITYVPEPLGLFCEAMGMVFLLPRRRSIRKA